MEMKLGQKSIALGFSNQGFTLIELLVAVAVSLLAMGAIYSTFRTQHKSFLIQQQVAAMQQNLRTAMFFMQREIRMAGCDPTGTANAGITAANANSISFTEDIWNGSAGSDPDGDTSDANENVRYSLSGSNLVNIGNQVVAENIDAIDFVYLDGSSPPNVLNPGGTNVSAGNLPLIRSVQITIVARTSKPLRPEKDNTVYKNQQGHPILGAPNDNFMRKHLTTYIRCRNLGL